MPKATVFHQFFISNKAYEGLVEQARDTGHIRSHQRNRGLGVYMSDLVNLNPAPKDWEDNRPRSLQQTTLEDLESGHLPQWDDGAPKYMRGITIALTTQPICLTLGQYFGIVKAGGRRFEPPALHSQVWEAIGLGWLKPRVVPKSHIKTMRRKSETELEW